MSSVYLDYNATTPPDPTVLEAMRRVETAAWGNPSSIHGIGRAARAVLDEARYRLAASWSCRPSEVVFTSGGTEANNLAILGTARLLRSRGRHLVVSPVEHHAVLHAAEFLARHEGFELTRLPVDRMGRVDPDDVRRALRPDTVLVSVMAANNEVGTLQPVPEIGAVCREAGVVFHTDAVQLPGKLPFDGMDRLGADLVAVCAHKFHGPRGAGALFVRSPLLPLPTQVGGAHENERRAGTENLPAILGLVDAFERFVPQPVFDPDRMRRLTGRILAALSDLPGVHVEGDPVGRLPNTVAFTVDGADSLGLLANLDLGGFCASSGSACSAGSLEPSHVLAAIGTPESRRNALVRFSLGRENTDAEIDALVAVLPTVIARSRGG